MSLVVAHVGSTNCASAQEPTGATTKPAQQADAQPTEQTLPSPSPDDGWRPRKLTPETPRVQERSVEAIPAAGPLSRFFNKKKAGEEFQPRTPPSPPAKNAFRADTKPESESEPAPNGFAPAMAGSWISRDSRKGVPSVEVQQKTSSPTAVKKPTASTQAITATQTGNMPASAGRTATEQIEPRKSSLDREPAKDALDTNVAVETTKTRPKSLELKPAAGRSEHRSPTRRHRLPIRKSRKTRASPKRRKRRPPRRRMKSKTSRVCESQNAKTSTCVQKATSQPRVLRSETSPRRLRRP